MSCYVQKTVHIKFFSISNPLNNSQKQNENSPIIPAINTGYAINSFPCSKNVTNTSSKCPHVAVTSITPTNFGIIFDFSIIYPSGNNQNQKIFAQLNTRMYVILKTIDLMILNHNYYWH